jgi:hypothetical protein
MSRTWNYRIIRYKGDNGFGLHEVHYDEVGLPIAMTESPATFACDDEEGPAGVVKSLERALKAAQELPVLDVLPDAEMEHG